MLDKTTVYYDLIMRRQANTPLPEIPLSPGFSLVGFQPGDEHAWAEIETAVLEFDQRPEALSYFTREYLAYTHELARRVLFVQAPDGEKVGTTTIWWEYTGKRRTPALHWVGVKPEFQGRGLGKGMVSLAMRECLAIEGDTDVYLHTQTWSYRAIGIYLQCGFRLLQSSTFGGHTNDYEASLPILRAKMSERSFALV